MIGALSALLSSLALSIPHHVSALTPFLFLEHDDESVFISWSLIDGFGERSNLSHGKSYLPLGQWERGEEGKRWTGALPAKT